MPYDHKNTTPDGLSSQRMKLMLKKLNYFHCQNRCMVGSGGGSVGFVYLSQIVLCYASTILYKNGYVRAVTEYLWGFRLKFTQGLPYGIGA